MDTRAAPDSGIACGEARVLVVDDDESTRLLFTRALQNDGFDVATAPDGAIALKLLRHTSFDLLLLDSRMPGMSGREVLARLRADLQHRFLPVILVTAEQGISRRAGGFLDGADDYLTKPVDFEELAARIRIQLRLHEDEERIQRTIDTANEAFIAWDETGVILAWNAHAEAIFGWEQDEVLGRDVADTIIASSSHDAYERAVARGVGAGDQTGRAERVELIGLLRDGREIPIELTTWGVRIGDSCSLSALVRSVPARRDLECSLRRGERLQALMDATPDVCILTDVEGTILFASPSCRSLLGHDPQELVGVASLELVHPEDRLRLAEMQSAAFDDHRTTNAMLRVRAKTGHYVSMDLIGSAVRAPVSGGLTGFQAVGRDVTDRRVQEIDRERALAELGSAKRGLEGALVREQDMVRELGDLLKLKDEFVATVSHELRTPLTSIVGYAEMLDDGELGELLADQHRVLIIMDQNARRLVALVEDLLTIGRIEARSFDSQRLPLALGPMIEGCGRTMLPSARSKSIILDLDVDPDLGIVVADASQIDRLLLNLLSNAVKFTPPGGRVAVTARSRPDDEIVIDVIDNGVGIPPAEQPQVFSRFFRSRRTIEEAIPGTGLGLAIVKSIVDQHDGRISLSSEPGRGTRVSVTLPRALASVESPRERPEQRERMHVTT